MSLIKQTYKNIEMLIINDGSNEVCGQLLEKLSKKDNRIKLYQFQERRGVGAARNIGVETAGGDYIYFLDSDDYLPETTLEILVNNIKDNQMIRGRVKTTDSSSGLAIILNGLFQVNLYTDKKYNLIKNNTALHF